MANQAKKIGAVGRQHARALALASLVITGAALLLTQAAPLPLSVDIAEVTANPAVLSANDVVLYHAAFTAQESGDKDGADIAMSQLSNKRLIGYILAKRYLSPGYTATKEELAQWLALYADQPQAVHIGKLAAQHGVPVPELKKEAPLKGEGYADNIGRSTMPDSWYRGLALWREKNYEAALPLFAAIGSNDDASDWQRSAGNYWAYRTALKLNQSAEAERYVSNAAQFPTTFYGLLAMQQTQGSADISARAPTVSNRLRAMPQTIRAALLVQLDRGDEAEEEIRRLYNVVFVTDRPGLVTLAHELSLPNLQVRLARIPQLSDAEALYASYPMPDYMTASTHISDPALMLAIARNESGFRESAASGAGAVGMMQMLPSTAHAVERRVGRELLSSASMDGGMGMRERLTDPATSVRFGAEYVKILMAEPVVGHNLVHILSAYNAGSGTVSGWQSAARQIDDPLLYIESIPYPETHNYVLQVMAQYWVYQSLLGEKPSTLVQLAAGQWPILADAKL